MTTLANIGGWTCASRISCAIVQRIVNSLIRKIHLPLCCIYFGSRRYEGYFTVPECNERSSSALGATIELSIRAIRCAADGKFNWRVIFSALSLYYNERYHSTATGRNSRVHCAREICVYVCVCVSYLRTCFWFQFWSPRNFRAETFVLIPRDRCVNHSKRNYAVSKFNWKWWTSLCSHACLKTSFRDIEKKDSKSGK